MTNRWQCLVIGDADDHDDDGEGGEKRVCPIAARVSFTVLRLSSGDQRLDTSLISSMKYCFQKTHYVNVS